MVTKTNFLICFFMCIAILDSYAQYGFVAKKLAPFGSIKPIKLNAIFINTKESNIYYSKLSSLEFPLIYKYDGDCGKFELRGKTFNLSDSYENRLACDLDLTIPNIFKVYKFIFRGQTYFALECINNGSRTSFILIHLFKINKDKIEYYPLWSRYGSIKCLGDFNNDGVLDFLKIRNNEKHTGEDTFKANLMSLDSLKNRFEDYPKSKEWYFKRIYTKENSIKIEIIKPIK